MLGAGALLYYDYKYVDGKPSASIFYFEVDFRRANVWASLTRTPSEAGCGCYHAAGFAAQERLVVAAAKALKPLL